jgi:hypothetical protein
MQCGQEPSRELERLRDDPRLRGYEEQYAGESAHQAEPADLARHLVDANPIGTRTECAAWLRSAQQATGSSRFALFMDLTGKRDVTLKVIEAVASLAAAAA